MQDRIDQFEWDIKMMENKTPYAAVQYIRRRIGYDDYLREWAKIHRTGEEDLFEILEQIGGEHKAVSDDGGVVPVHGRVRETSAGSSRRRRSAHRGVSGL